MGKWFKLLIFCLLINTNNVFAQTTILTDTVDYIQEYEVFYKKSLHLINIIKNSEKINKELVVTLNAQNEDEQNLKSRLEFSKNCFQEKSPSSNINCTYKIVKVIENEMLTRSTLKIYFQFRKGTAIFSYNFQTQQLISFLMFKKISENDFDEMMEKLINKK